MQTIVQEIFYKYYNTKQFSKINIDIQILIGNDVCGSGDIQEYLM